MTQITARQPAPENTRYAPGCFDSQIGKVVAFKIGGGTVECQLTAAEVVDEGAAVNLTVELPDGLPAAVQQSINAVSIGTHP